MTTATKHRTGGSTGANGYGQYQVRYASDRQKFFINSLLETKEHTFGEVDVEQLNVQGATDLIKTLLALPNKAGVINPASAKQISFATSLIKQKDGGLDVLNHYLRNRKVNELEQLDRKDVSAIISQLVNAKETKPPMKITEVGAYLLDEVIYSIRQSSESRRWSVWTYDDVSKKYVRNSQKDNVLYEVEPKDRLTLELAIKYSAQVGICVHCGRTLTLLKSVAGGMGAYCAKKYH